MNLGEIIFPEGRKKALTLSYDDGTIYDRRLVEIFNKFSLKATFHLNGGFLGQMPSSTSRGTVSADEVKALYRGHEIAAHTYTHPLIERIPLPMVANEIIKDREMLESLVGYPVTGFSYPFGSYNEDIINQIKTLGIEYGRIVGDSDDFNVPTDFFRWLPTCHHGHRLMENAQNFIENTFYSNLNLFYVWGHSYEFENENNWSLIEGFAEYISGHDDVWYVTNIEFKRYMDAAERLIFTLEDKVIFNPNHISVWLCVDEDVIEVTPGMNVIK